MQFTGELTLGAIGVMVSVIGSACAGIGTMVTIFLRTRSDINALQIGHADLKSDVIDVKGEVKLLGAQFQKQEIMLERIAARQEIMGAITNVPNDIAAAIGKLIKKENEKDRAA